MKKWWNKTPGEFWMDLFVREKTRWIAVVLFFGAVIVANWMVIDAALEGRTFGRFGRIVTEASEPLSFSFWVTWRSAIAVVLDLVLLWAVITVWRGRKKPIQPPQTTTGSGAPGRV
jgi:hypothetical protein